MPIPSGFIDRCVSVDLEVNPGTARLFAFAAVKGASGEALVHSKGNLTQALEQLERFCTDADHIIGHNILRYDLPHLLANRPEFAKLSDRIIDTLWLNPLAFPRNPYHHLVKHHQDGRLQAGHVNDPELDARLVIDVLQNQFEAFQRIEQNQPDALAAYHFLTTRMEAAEGFDAVFQTLRSAPAPSVSEAEAAIRRLLEGQCCTPELEQTLNRIGDPQLGWPMAFALSWISVAGGESVMPPWVRAQFRQASMIVRQLRGTSCHSPECKWCTKFSDPIRALDRWFGFPSFRPEPVDESGRPMQERIVAEAMKDESLLGILPTGTGKSICYQIPALSNYERTGALTVVISPLVALMTDQVEGLKQAGISSAVTVNGMLSLPERHDALEKVRMGDAAILLIAPEQLRSVSVRAVLAQREVRLWVLDEAHCISKWGHDFRPDYRYISRFIREFSGDQPPAPVLCLTATAKPDVVRDIRDHFMNRLSLELMLLDGGARRTNLNFAVLETQKHTKLADILATINKHLPDEGASGAIIYCATRRKTEQVAEFLQAQGLAAEHFHAGLKPEQKREVQEKFRNGELRVIAATNAFGMGIDKPDIRLVVHGDIPGSLENYFQEAGRAGRDRAPANCVLLFSTDDVERQFNLSARSRLARHEIGAILKALKRMNDRTKKDDEIVATSGEIIREEKDQEFERDSATNDTRVKTAVAWLEESKLLSREENRVQIFPSSLRIRTIKEAETILSEAKITEDRRQQLIDLVRHIMNTPADSGISTDELMGVCRLPAPALRKALSDLETLGIASDDTTVTVFVHVGVADSSQQRLDLVSQLENDLIARLRELAPDALDNEALPLHLSETCQALRQLGHPEVRPDIVEGLLRGMTQDGRDLEGGRGNLYLRKINRNMLKVRLQRSWDVIADTARLRHQGTQLLLTHLTELSKGARGKDVQVETTFGDMLAVLNGDVLLRDQVRDMTRLLDRALMWPHELNVMKLGQGLTIFRQAMTVWINPKGGGFTKENFLPLEEHYSETTMQTHVMAKFAETGLDGMPEALKLSEDYFQLDRDSFLRRWMPKKDAEIRRQTTGASWNKIVKSLNNPVQEEIVRDDREQTNVLVLAGPGSGKTRVLVHRIAYLIRVRREDPRGILVLSYNRHAATQIRERLRQLIGQDATGVTVSTCHALAMRLIGASFAGLHESARDFEGIVRNATQLLNGNGLDKTEAESLRETLIQGYRWILVDEYQDIGPEEYDLIAAVAGRSLEDPDLRLSLFAVGDDDQNIYAFAGASIEFIRRFESDYKARPKFLTGNFRSTAHIIDASNDVIAPATNRMKAGHDITIDRDRISAPSGGAMEALDPVAQGRVSLLSCPPGDLPQAVAAVDELLRLSRLDPDWQWSRTAIIAREWKRLEPVRAYAETVGLDVELASESTLSLWRMREMQRFIQSLSTDRSRLLSVDDLIKVLNGVPHSRWTDLIGEGIGTLAQEITEKEIPVPELIEWFGEWSHEARSEQRELLLLTAHRAKGLEFDHVAILDGGWDRRSNGEDSDAPRRLYYVAMTRARASLTLLKSGKHPFIQTKQSAILERRVTPDTARLDGSALQYVSPDPKLVDLSFAGRLGNHNPSLTAIAKIQVGDPISLRFENSRWEIASEAGQVLGRMSKAFIPPKGLKLLKGKVAAILTRRSEDSDDENFRHLHRRDTWEVILPELVFGEDDSLAD